VAIEDFTTYTETDPNSRLTVTASKILAAALVNEDAWVYDDKGVDHFDALNVEFEAYQNSAGVDDGRGALGFSDTIGKCDSWESDAVHLEIVDQGTNGPASQLTRGAHLAVDSNSTLSEDTLYYWTYTRTAGNDTITAKVYSNADRTTLLDTLTLAGFGTAKYRYAYGFVRRQDGVNAVWEGYFQNMDLNEGATFTPRLTIY